ncbi:hypothetical protein CRYUN_Cryun10bG0141000 [Craigia yunnanensis]
MAESVVSNVATRVGELVIQEAKFLRGVEDQVNRLQRELRWMKSFLKEADSRQSENDMVRMWVAEIRDIAYDAEDVIESFALKIASKRTGGISNVIKRYACILKEGRMLHKVRSDMERITNKITDLSRRLQLYGMKELPAGKSSSSSSSKRQQLRQSYPHIVEANVVGLDGNIKELVSVLVDEERHFRVASICGMGGLGKTTLAKKVYHHSQVRNHFKYFVWAYISQQCQRETVWKGICSSLGFRDDKGAILKVEDRELAGKLYNFLKENQCLVVLDDIWSTQDWDMIKDAFPMEGTGSKILLTSRNKDLALYADSRGCLHELQCLTDEDGWKLFQHITFPRSDSADYIIEEKMEELGKDMVKRCAGMPLAIVVLGGILATKPSLNDWQIVHENVKSYLRRGGAWGIHEALALSYDNLPAYLKPCFLYLSLFPEDYEIPADKLIQLWVAEDIVPLAESEGNGEEFVEDVAERYLNELVERYMVLVAKRDASLKIKTCRMHDLIRDLCLLKAKQENFSYIVVCHKLEQTDNVSISSSAIGKVRRLAMHDSVMIINSIKNPLLRSLLFFEELVTIELLETSGFLKSNMIWFEKQENDTDMLTLVESIFRIISTVFIASYLVVRKTRGLMRHICNNFKRLRVLDFEGTELLVACKILSDIGSLFHLRFLSLGQASSGSRLPSSIRKLRCLQTLDLRGHPFHVPNVLWKMERLRHLYLPEQFSTKTKLKLDNLRNLQTLVNFSTKNCYLGDVVYMKKLRKLEISTPFIVEKFMEDLNLNPPIIASKHLRSLCIRNFRNTNDEVDPRHLTYLLSSCVFICELDLSVTIRKLPEPQYISSNIAYICLSLSKLDEDPMPTLEKLPKLSVLELKEGAFEGKLLVCSAQGFPRLDSLSIMSQLNFEELRVSEGAMTNLRHLMIADCRKLRMLPDELRSIAAVKELKIESMPKAFRDKLVQGGEDYYKLQHVPSVIFQNCDD